MDAASLPEACGRGAQPGQRSFRQCDRRERRHRGGGGVPRRQLVDGNQQHAKRYRQRFGCAYVYVLNGGTWSQEAYLKPAIGGRAAAGDNFGISGAVSGDTSVGGACGSSRLISSRTQWGPHRQGTPSVFRWASATTPWLWARTSKTAPR